MLSKLIIYMLLLGWRFRLCIRAW